MPKKGSVFLLSNRDYVFNPEFFKKVLKEKNELDIDYKTAKAIINTANDFIGDAIVNEIDGFKLPYGFGYISAASYDPGKPILQNWPETKRLGKPVYFTNMHTNGLACKISWYRVGKVRHTSQSEAYSFTSMKKVRKAVSDSFKNGKDYRAWTVGDFIAKGKTQNLMNKRFYKEENAQ